MFIANNLHNSIEIWEINISSFWNLVKRSIF